MQIHKFAPTLAPLRADPEVHLMVTSVYDWMLGQERPSIARDGEAKARTEDILVRILRALDAEATKTPMSST